MFCKKCKGKVKDNANFCENCGVKIAPTAKSNLNIAVYLICFFAFIGIIIFIVNQARSSVLLNPSQQKINLISPQAPPLPPSVLKHMNYTIPDLGMKLIYVASGSFRMGSKDGELDEKPVHKVTISKGYWIGKYEITQREYQLIMLTNPSYYKNLNKPVECVNWYEAVEFCKKLTEREFKAGRLLAAYEYRLPTEAEWEYAAHGGSKSRGYKYSGSNNIDKVAWYSKNSSRQTHEVGGKTANEIGVHDMSGNVWEWCLDRCNKSGVVSGLVTDTYKNNTVDPFCNSSYHIFRGGGWYRGEDLCRVTNRAGNSPDRRLYYLGFRVVLGQKL